MRSKYTSKIMILIFQIITSLLIVIIIIFNIYYILFEKNYLMEITHDKTFN